MLTITNQAHPLWFLHQRPSFTSTYQAHLPKCLNCRRLLCACEISRRVVSSSKFNSVPCRGNKTDARPQLTQKQFTEISDHELGAPNKIYRGLHPSGTSGGPHTVKMLTQLQVSTISRAFAVERKVMRAASACRWDLNLERIRPHDMDIWRWRIWTHEGTFVRPYYFGENWHVYLRPKCSENYPFLIISHSKWLGLAW